MQVVLDADEAASKPLLGLLRAQTPKMCQLKGGTLGATTCLYPLQLHCTPVRAQFTPSKPLHVWSGALRLGGGGVALAGHWAP